MIKEPEKIEKYAKPLLSGNKDKTSIILGDLGTPQDAILSNLEQVEVAISQSLKWAKSKAGKQAGKDRGRQT